jgi:hypothetical protein
MRQYLKKTRFIYDITEIYQLTLVGDFPHSWIWREENGFIYLSSLPLSLPLSLPSAHLE